MCPEYRRDAASGSGGALPLASPRAPEGLDGPSLVEWITMAQEGFSARFKGSPIERAKRRGLLRNVAVALGNWG